MDHFELLEELVAIPSPSGEEGAYAERVGELLRAEGYAVELPEVAPGRPNLVARPATGPAPTIYFSTHLDVVPPHLPPRREGDALYGRGTADTKGPLVAMLEAARRLRAEGVATGFLLVVGEEVDHCGARHAAATLDLGGARILLGEPTSNRVVSAQKGLLKLQLRAEGVAGHSAFPDRGVSAIHRLLDALSALRGEAWPDEETLGQTDLNVGTIKGGVAANVFAPAAEAVVLFRLCAPVDSVLARVDELLGEGVSREVISRNDPAWLDSPPGFPTCVIPFNSDATYLAPLGPVWLCGPGAIELAHSEHEHIRREDLLAGVESYVALARAATAR
ncbi:MAG: M20/M25/M40 family metallo-hydrolase [Planctomycetota bacterium]